MQEKSNPPIVGISAGDLNGIGMEVILKTFSNPDMMEVCTPVVFASSKAASYHRNALGFQEFKFNIIRKMDEVRPGSPNLMNCWEEEVDLSFGQESAKVGCYAVKSIEQACEAIDRDEIEALITAPIHKKSIQNNDFQFSGHTDFLEARFRAKATMLMVSEQMRMGLATVHIPVAQIPQALTQKVLYEKIMSLHRSLQDDFLISKGRIAVLALNPHAGDGGVIGEEDQEIVRPAIEQAMDDGALPFGPYPADSFFGSGKYRQFDAILATYHDQGLVPFKSLSFGQGVNYSAGLPFVRTSPDHGTAFEIAGEGIADESSFRQAVYLACDLVKNRRVSSESKANPLKPRSQKN